MSAVDTTVRHIAFFSFPGFGHIRPTLPVVRELIRRGHEVTYVVAQRFADAVEQTGARTISYPSTFPVSVPPVHTTDELAEVVVEYIREAFAAFPLAWEAFSDHPVDLVVEDALSTAVSRFTARRSGAPVVRLFAGFGGNDEVPLNGSEPEPGDPTLTAEHPAITACQHELLDRLRPYGVDAEEIERIRVGGEVAANLVFIPREFQPRAECFDDSFVFVGPVVDDRPVTSTWRRPPTATKVVLISLGTSSNSNPEFFHECAQAFADTGWQLVMVTGGHLAQAQAQALPGRVEVHDWLDFSAVLPQVDLVVCQAGTGTLMDAFRHGVGVVTVPQQPDARVIARHVEQLGLGRALLDDVTATVVRDAAVAVVEDQDIARNVARMRAAIQASGGADAAADALERIAVGIVQSERE